MIRVPQERLTRITESPNTFRPGQIVQGKILKIYPNHRAELQVGSQKMIAQLEASLAVGERYHFQVANTQDMIELKVIGTNLKSEIMQNVTQLLNELNIHRTRSTVQFTQLLLNEEISFTKQELQQALQLLQQANGSKEAQRTLFEMLGRQLPMTSSVFNALTVKNASTVTNELTNLLNVLQNTTIKNETQTKLLNELSQLLQSNRGNQQSSQQPPNLLNQLTTHFSNTEITRFATQLVEQRDQVITNMNNLLNNLPTHSANMTQFNVEHAKIMINQMPLTENVKQVLLTLLENDQPQFLNLARSLVNSHTFTEIQSYLNNQLNNTSIQTQFLSHIQQFIQMSGLAYENEVQQFVERPQLNIEQQLAQFLNVKSDLQPRANTIVNKWANLVNNNIQSLSNEQIHLFKRDIEEQIVRFLPEGQRQSLLNLMQNNENLPKVWQFLQTLQKDETFNQINSQLLNLRQGNITLSPQMLSQMTELNTLLQSLHIPLDITSQSDMNEQMQQTLKGMLMQMTQQGPTNISEQAQQFLHFINGLQLNSVHETSHFIQASIQVPGERIHLNDDLYMDFESRKTDDGKIDADYCRILFYLNLNALEETVIDMNVQKRFVTLTIYNDHPHLNHLAKPLHKPLNDGLNALDYQLSTVRFERLTERDVSVENDVKKREEKDRSFHQGVDVRI